MKSAILVIDVQRFLFDPEPQPFEATKVVQRINSLTAWGRNSDHIVVFVQHEQDNTPMEYKSEGWQLQSALAVTFEDKFIRKTTPDSFLNTDLEVLLRQQEVEHLIVCGYATEFCVDTTVRRAAGLGYSVELVSDAHTTHDKDHATGEVIRNHHNCTLPNIASFGVKITAPSTLSVLQRK